MHNEKSRLLIIVIYLPRSTAVHSPIFDEFADVIERMAIHLAPIVIVGDTNVHLHDSLAIFQHLQR